jgi:hypothetical protein
MLEFRGYDFYNLNEFGVEFKFGPEQIVEAKKFGVNETEAFNLMLGKFIGMQKRDQLIRKHLIDLGIKSVIDIGGDKGGLARCLEQSGIEVKVLDPNPDAIKYLKNNNIDCNEASVNDFTKNPKKYIKNLSHPTAVVCLNFTHVPWKNEIDKKLFFETLNSTEVETIIFSFFGVLPSLFDNFSENKEFNIYSNHFNKHQKILKWLRKFRLIKFFKYFNYLKENEEYVSMQRMLIRNK